jgi:hypothetical protein
VLAMTKIVIRSHAAPVFDILRTPLRILLIPPLSHTTKRKEQFISLSLTRP